MEFIKALHRGSFTVPNQHLPLPDLIPVSTAPLEAGAPQLTKRALAPCHQLRGTAETNQGLKAVRKLAEISELCEICQKTTYIVVSKLQRILTTCVHLILIKIKKTKKV